MLIALMGMSSLSAKAVNIQTFHFLNDSSETASVNYTNNGGTSFSSVSAGRYKATLNGGSSFYVMCVDLTHHIGWGDSYQADADQKLTDAKGTLTGSYYNGGISSALMNHSDYGLTISATEAQRRADMSAYLIDNYLNTTTFTGASGSTNLIYNLVAIQLAEWDILQDGGNGVGTGSFQIDAGGITNYGSLINYYEGLASANTNYVSLHDTWIQAPVSNDGSHTQNFATNQANVPEPSAIASFIGLLVTGGTILIKQRRK